MARAKVNLQLISNASKRRSTFKRRRTSLLKKTKDLATLCNVKVCVVVYEEKDEGQPAVWPSDEEEAKEILTKYKEMPELGSFKNAKNQETFLEDRGFKLHEQVRKLELENHEHETLFLLHESMDGHRPNLVGTGENELVRLRNTVEMKMSKVNARLEHLVGEQIALPEQPLVVQISSDTEMQRMVQPEEQHPLLQQVADPTLNEAERSAMFAGVFAGSSGEPSVDVCNVMQPYNLGPYTGFAEEQ